MAKVRGRESAGDMIRSLGLVLGIVLGVFLLAGTPKSNEQRLRVVDPSGDVRAFSELAPQVPVPGALPGWQATVTYYERDDKVLRVGWVTPMGEYAEYAAAASPDDTFLREFAGGGTQDGSVDVGGVTWAQYRGDDGLSLVRTVGGATVVIGTVRDTASLEELRVLAGSLRA